mmetsp:Transcript_14714/g.50807  ORF Transcript_14714/g.50807 Transcript_14714/m.50807 type:complete len:287 (-) Transcript_14714:1956-2816(-)
MTLALLNMPSLRETTMNWDALKCARSMLPMFCVWLRSSAASTSSRMYMGAGLKRSMDSTRLSAMSDRWPPLSSESESFQRLPNATLTSRPSSTVSPAGGSSLALAPGSRLEKMDPKSWFTLRHVASSVSCFLTSSSPMTASIFALSRATVPFFVSCTGSAAPRWTPRKAAMDLTSSKLSMGGVPESTQDDRALIAWIVGTSRASRYVYSSTTFRAKWKSWSGGAWSFFHASFFGFLTSSSSDSESSSSMGSSSSAASGMGSSGFSAFFFLGAAVFSRAPRRGAASL